MAKNQDMELYITLKTQKINAIRIMKVLGKMGNKMVKANSLFQMATNT